VLRKDLRMPPHRFTGGLQAIGRHGLYRALQVEEAGREKNSLNRCTGIE